MTGRRPFGAGALDGAAGRTEQLAALPASAAGALVYRQLDATDAHGWAGLGSVWTDPAYRGRGLAAHLTARLAAAAHAEGVTLVHLQVEHDNETAIRLYRRLGFVMRDTNVYRWSG